MDEKEKNFYRGNPLFTKIFSAVLGLSGKHRYPIKQKVGRMFNANFFCRIIKSMVFMRFSLS